MSESAKKTTRKSRDTSNSTDQPANLRGSLVGVQKRVLDFQKSAFERAFDAYVSMEERREDWIHGWMERSERLPQEWKDIYGQWTELAQKGRENYKSAMEKTFDLAHAYVDGQAEAPVQEA